MNFGFQPGSNPLHDPPPSNVHAVATNTTLPVRSAKCNSKGPRLKRYLFLFGYTLMKATASGTAKFLRFQSTRDHRLQCGVIDSLRANSFSQPFSTDISLQDRTKLFLDGPVDDSQVISLLQEWKTAAANARTNDGTNCHKIMKDIVHHWLCNTDYPSTTEPFLLLLQHYQAHRQEHAAMTTLDVWGSTLGGDLEQSPTLEAFHLVLRSTPPCEPGEKHHPEKSNFGNARESVLARLEVSHALGNFSLMPTVETYAHVIHAYHIVGEPLPTNLVRKLQNAFEWALQRNWTNQAAYHMIRGYSKALACRPKFADALTWFDTLVGNLKRTDALHFALTVQKPEERVLSLFGRAYQSIFQALLDNDESELDNAVKAKALLDDLEALEWEDLPWTEHYTYAIRCWARSSLLECNADQVVRELSRRFQDQHLSQDKPLPLAFYESVILFWCEIGKPADAELLLNHVMDLHAKSRIKFKAPIQFQRLYHAVLGSYFRANELEKVFHAYEQMHPLLHRDSPTYTIVLKSISRMNGDAVGKAGKVWQDMLADPDAVPKSTHYGALITMWSRSSADNAAEYALEALNMLETRYKENACDHSLKPQQGLYTGVICAMARSSHHKDDVNKALEVFNRMKQYHQPDAITYSALISALIKGRSVDSALKAEELLTEMELLAALPEGFGCAASKVTFTSVAHAWAVSGSPKALENAERIFQKLEEKYRDTGDEALRPDDMAFGVMINCWASSRRPDAGVHVDRLLEKARRMEDQTGERLLNTVTYSSAMLAHWRSHDPLAFQRVEALLKEMKDRVAEGDQSCAPDQVTYTTVIQALSRSDDPVKATKAWAILNEVLEDFNCGKHAVKPNVYMFTAVLNACAFTRGSKEERQQAVSVALEVMREFRSKNYDQASSAMYATLLRVFEGQMKNDVTTRMNYVENTFQQCCADGLVDDVILQYVEKNARSLFDNLPRDQNQQLKLPHEWSMNVNPRSARKPGRINKSSMPSNAY